MAQMVNKQQENCLFYLTRTWRWLSTLPILTRLILTRIGVVLGRCCYRPILEMKKLRPGSHSWQGWEADLSPDGYCQSPGCFHLSLCMTTFMLWNIVQYSNVFTNFHYIILYEGYEIIWHGFTFENTHWKEGRDEACFSINTPDRCLRMVSSVLGPPQV